MPVTSPARHSITLCRPAPRSTKMAMWPGQHDEEARHRHPLRAQHVSLVEMPQRPVRGQPRQLLARRRAEGLVLGEPIDEIGHCHWIAPG